jgi:hypothetical protein
LILEFFSHSISTWSTAKFQNHWILVYKILQFALNVFMIIITFYCRINLSIQREKYCEQNEKQLCFILNLQNWYNNTSTCTIPVWKVNENNGKYCAKNKLRINKCSEINFCGRKDFKIIFLIERSVFEYRKLFDETIPHKENTWLKWKLMGWVSCQVYGSAWADPPLTRYAIIPWPAKAYVCVCLCVWMFFTPYQAG